MTVFRHNPAEVFPPYRRTRTRPRSAETHACSGVTGLNGYEADGKTLPDSFAAQAELIWKHLRTILASAGMDTGDLVSLRTYLADPA